MANKLLINIFLSNSPLFITGTFLLCLNYLDLLELFAVLKMATFCCLLKVSNYSSSKIFGTQWMLMLVDV